MNKSLSMDWEYQTSKLTKNSKYTQKWEESTGPENDLQSLMFLIFFKTIFNGIDLNEILKARRAVWCCAHAVICLVSKNKFEMGEGDGSQASGKHIYSRCVHAHIWPPWALLLSSRTGTVWIYAKIFNLQTPSPRLSCFGELQTNCISIAPENKLMQEPAQVEIWV